MSSSELHNQFTFQLERIHTLTSVISMQQFLFFFRNLSHLHALLEPTRLFIFGKNSHLLILAEIPNYKIILCSFKLLFCCLKHLKVGRHGILIFSCLLFVLFEKICSIKSCHFTNHGILIEKTKPDSFLISP